MIKIDSSPCRAHILVCINQRPPSSSMPSCADHHGEEIFELIRRFLQEHRLLGKVWLTRTLCLGWCHPSGTTVAFYPQGDFYRAVTPETCPALLEHYLSSLISSS